MENYSQIKLGKNSSEDFLTFCIYGYAIADQGSLFISQLNLSCVSDSQFKILQIQLKPFFHHIFQNKLFILR